MQTAIPQLDRVRHTPSVSVVFTSVMIVIVVLPGRLFQQTYSIADLRIASIATEVCDLDASLADYVAEYSTYSAAMAASPRAFDELPNWRER